MLYRLSYVRASLMLAARLVDDLAESRENRPVGVRGVGSIASACIYALAAAAVALGGGPPKWLPLWQRVLQGGDLPGFMPQSLPPALLSKSRFVSRSEGTFVRLTKRSATTQLTKDGFKHALIENLLGRDRTSGSSTVVQLGSPPQAHEFLSVAYRDSLEPCPHTCTVSAFEFSVPGIPGAMGSRRVRFNAAGPKQPAFESDAVYFADGALDYAIIEMAQPNQVNRQALVAAANTLYHRVHGSLPPRSE